MKSILRKNSLLIILTISIPGLAFFYWNNYKAKSQEQIYKVQEEFIENSESTLQEGDIIFQTSQSSQSKAIQLATNSKYSHMGIIYETNGELYVYEAVQPVKLTRLNDWIKRGEHSHYVVKRLKDQTLLSKENLKKMRVVGEKFKGKNYDIYFEWSDNKIYCSELVWKIYQEALGVEIGNLQELSEFDLSSSLVKNIMHERYKDEIPLNEKVISPGKMFDSDKLVTVKEN